jgi:hypothetical protein
MSKKTGLFAASAANLILASIAGWAVSDTQAVATPATVQINPFQLAEHFAVIRSYSEASNFKLEARPGDSGHRPCPAAATRLGLQRMAEFTLNCHR